MVDFESSNVVLNIKSERAAREVALSYAYRIEDKEPLKATELRKKVFNNMNREELLKEIKPYKIVNRGLSYESMTDEELRKSLVVIENQWRCLI